MEIEQFLMFAQCLPVPALLIDQESGLVAANSVARLMLGLDKKRESGQLLANYVNETPAEVAAYLQACVRADQPVVGILTCRGDNVRMLCYARALDPGAPDTSILMCCTPSADKSKDADNFGLQVETLHQEIVRREKIEAELAATEARAQAVLDTAAEGIITIDQHAIIKSFNQAAERIFGYLAKEVIGANVACLMPQPYHSEHDGYIRHYLDTGEKKIIGIGRTVAGRHKEGRIFPMNLAVSEVIAGGKRHFTGIVRDISEQVEAEDEARQHRERLAHFDRVSTMGAMASGIAHEINQPLTAISSYAHACYRLIENGVAETADLLEVLDKISAQALRAGDVIHNLRRFVKKRESRRELCDLNQVVRSALALAETDAREHNFVIETAFADSSLHVIVDVIQIQQVVINLIRNALEAMANVAMPNDVVIVNISTAQDDPTTAQVAVKDTGLGITEAHTDKLFDPFFTTKATGTGIGLAISRTIITSHGGRLWFERNQNSGITMHFTLPLASDERTMTKPAQTVFIVDDDAAVCDSLQLLMRSVGIAAEVYDSAHAFVADFDPQRSGCLVLDVRMPGMNGLDLAKALREREAMLPIIFISGHGDVPMAVEAMRLGAMDFMQKPFRDQELLDRIFAALKQDAVNRQARSEQQAIGQRLMTLTPRECQVLDMLLEGKANKVIAADLEVSQRTVEIHRAHIMEKMQTRSLAALVKMVMQVRS